MPGGLLDLDCIDLLNHGQRTSIRLGTQLPSRIFFIIAHLGTDFIWYLYVKHMSHKGYSAMPTSRIIFMVKVLMHTVLDENMVIRIQSWLTIAMS